MGGATSYLVRFFAIFTIIIALLLGNLLLVDPEIDARVKLMHISIKYLAMPLILKNGTFDRWFLNQVNLEVPTKLQNGINSVDLLIPSLDRSCYEGSLKANSVKVRYYHRDGKLEKLPIVIFFHGGGNVLGRATDFQYDALSRNFVTEGPYSLLSVDYRLAPEHTIPEGIDDCLSAVFWVRKNEEPYLQKYSDTTKIILMGDSAGGYLAATVSQYLLDHYPEVKISHQILMYPSLHPSEPTASKKKYANGYILYKEISEAFKAAHSPKTPEFLNSSLYRPMNAASLKGLPSTHVVLADQDMLYDEGRMYYERMVQEGLKVNLNVYEHTPHGFMTLDFLPQTQKAWNDIHAILKDSLK